MANQDFSVSGLLVAFHTYEYAVGTEKALAYVRDELGYQRPTAEPASGAGMGAMDRHSRT